MSKLLSKNTHLVTEDNVLVIFCCFEIFRRGYLRLHDLSSFSEANVQTVINEEKRIVILAPLKSSTHIMSSII
jgi:hypothetical protein|uniref:Uncharacterized protein n=1 Tax=Enterobacter asburiae TaxID=61645 RepID=A0A455VXM3_ENTAS|nr:hypothetical protein MRY18106EAS_12870 [Enterobacter asburiae]